MENKLTHTQIELGAKYLALTNSGVDVRNEEIESAYDLDSIYYKWDNNFALECDCGLDDEVEMWKNNIKNDSNEFCLNMIKKDIPWLLEI